MEVILTWSALAALAALLAYIAVGDLRARLIPNWTVAAIAALAIPYWAGRGLTLSILLEQACVFAAATLLFGLLWQYGNWTGRRLLGGGDLKLYMALALWLPAGIYLEMLIWMSLVGLALSLIVFAHHRHARKPGRVRVPYGVAIVAGTFAVLGEQIVKQFPA